MGNKHRHGKGTPGSIGGRYRSAARDEMEVDLTLSIPKPDTEAAMSKARECPHSLGLVVLAGSHAYGLATPASDTDLRGFYLADPAAFLGLHRPAESWTRTEPDVALHEAGKFTALALAANPTALEVLATDAALVTSGYATALRDNIDAFLSARVRKTYGGYAHQQFARLQARGDGSFSADTRKRTEKHTRHLFRLLEQGEHLLRTGEIRVRCPDPERLFELGRLGPDQVVAEAQSAFERFESAPCSLPPRPDEARVNDMLVECRRSMLT